MAFLDITKLICNYSELLTASGSSQGFFGAGFAAYGGKTSTKGKKPLEAVKSPE